MDTMSSCPPFLLLLYGRPVNQYDISGHVTGQGSLLRLRPLPVHHPSRDL